ASGTSATSVGGMLTDTFTVTNAGAAPATGVTFTDTLPAGATYFAAPPSQGNCTGTTTATCSLGSIDSSETGTVDAATITILFVPNNAGSVLNTGSVTESETDSNPVDNTASVSATVTDMTEAGSTTTTPGTSIRSLAFVAPVVLTGRATETSS